jgi:hypothetical protein
MTKSFGAVSDADCSQVFTEKHGEFTLSNDTVTAMDPFVLFITQSQQTARRKGGTQ